MTRQLRPDLIAKVDPLPPEQGPFNSQLLIGYVPIAGQIAYTLDPDWITVPSGWAATETTYVEFNGRTAWAQRSQIPFHVTSLDWQESDRLLAGIMTAFGAPTGAIHDRRPRRVRRRRCSRRSRGRASRGISSAIACARGTSIWGHGVADLVIENSYVDDHEEPSSRTGSRDRRRGPVLARLSAQGRRRGDQRASSAWPSGRWRICATRSSSTTIRSTGLASGEFHIYGQVPDARSASAGCRSTDGKAYGETVRRRDGEPALRRRPACASTASTSRRARGASPARPGSRGTATTRSTPTARGSRSNRWSRCPFPRAPLSGLLHFTASGTGTFESPRYDVRLRRRRSLRRRRRHRPGAAAACRSAASC